MSVLVFLDQADGHIKKSSFEAANYAAKIAAQMGTVAEAIVFSNNTAGKAIAPRLSVRLKAGLVSGAVALPDTNNGFIVKKNVFSGKAFANVVINTAIKIISLNPNSFSVITTAATAEVTEFAATVDAPKVEVTNTNKIVGEVPLS